MQTRCGCCGRRCDTCDAFIISKDLDTAFFQNSARLHDDAAAAGSHVTRFIALGSVGNPAKAKSLHALALTPAADMDIAALTQRPDGTTPCPYELPSSLKAAFAG